MKYILLIFILVFLIVILQNNKEHFLNTEEGTYKKKPFNFNSRNIVDSIDEGVLGNLRIVENSNSYSEDINFNQMNKLLEDVLLFNNHSVSFKNIIEDDYKNISLKVISLINGHFKKYNLNNEYHKTDERKYELIKFEKLLDEDKNDSERRLVINIEFYKKLMNTSFVIQFDLIYSPLQNYIDIIDAVIIGQKINEKIHFKNLDWNQTYCNLEDYEKYLKNPGLYKTKLQQCHKEQLITNDEMRLHLQNIIERKEKTGKPLSSYEKKMKQFVKQFLEKKDITFFKAEKEFFFKKKESEKVDNEYKKYKCFGKDGFNESTCRSYSFDKKTVGTWDKPCNTDKECPFYKKNKNYKNNRGGCIKGFCEMPLNIQKLGYKEYNKNIKPFCHKCNIKDCLGEDCYTCCEEQRNNKDYPNLKTPDYAFENDGRQ